MEGLKLIDLGNEVSYIDVDTSKVPYTFSVKLGDRTFAFSIRYNEVGGFFTVDLSIASTGEVLVYGDIVRYGRPLFNSVEDERFPVPVIMPLCLTGDDISEVTFENFGKEVRLGKECSVKFWKRQATLQIGSKRFGMDDLYFKFTVPFEDSEKLGTATIEAYNLSPATRNSIKKGMPIILNAGYEGDIGAIFTGKVSQVSDKHSGTEVITTIAAAEALEEWLSKEVNKTYTAGSKASAIVKDLLNIFGLEVGTMELAVDKEYPRGKVCKGKVKNVLTEIVTSDCKSRFLIRNGIVTINDPKTGTKTGYVLSAESGLLKAAEATDRTETTTRQTTVKDGKEKQEVTYKRECLLNYHLAPADVVKIKSDTLNGNHLIKGGQHTGCPDGDWKTTIEVKPV